MSPGQRQQLQSIVQAMIDEDVSEEKYGRPFSKWFYLLFAFTVIAIGLNGLNMVRNILVFNLPLFLLAAFSLWIIWWTNRVNLMLVLNRIRMTGKVTLRGKITQESPPELARLARIIPGYRRIRPKGRLARFRNLNRDIRQTKYHQRIIERRLKRLDPGIIYVEANSYGYKERNFRLWFRTPADAVAFKLRYFDEFTILDIGA